MTLETDTLPAPIQQPGPAGQAWASVPVQLQTVDFELPVGISLAVSFAQAIKESGLSGAYLRVIDMPLSKLFYVIPALSPDGQHVAWYSETHKPMMPGKIEDAGFICGYLEDAMFYHGHGLLCDAQQASAMGHFLPDDCIPSTSVQVKGLGFTGARFNRVADAETSFDLFMPEAVDVPPSASHGLTTLPSQRDGLLLRIGANVSIDQSLIECCQQAGWEKAIVHGVGSLIGVHFADGRLMSSFATEVLITQGMVDLSETEPQVNLDIAVVGLEGTFMRGRLASNQNRVLITMELVLEKVEEMVST